MTVDFKDSGNNYVSTNIMVRLVTIRRWPNITTNLINSNYISLSGYNHISRLIIKLIKLN